MRTWRHIISKCARSGAEGRVREMLSGIFWGSALKALRGVGSVDVLISALFPHVSRYGTRMYTYPLGCEF